ncbi:MAG: hypothetical protein KDK36_13030, partial [Leptospiraceae bacterium]|nr:hypothetical protein [Leptospiraceae bacterium]
LNKLKKGKYRVGVFINSENLVVNLESSHFIIPFTEIKGYERYFHKERDAENNISTEYTIILVMNDEKRIRLPKEFLWYEIFEKFGWKELVEPIHSEKYKKYYLNIGIPEDQNLANEIRMGYWEKGKIERE